MLLLTIADDFTGALDTGVQFAARNLKTRVVIDPDIDFSDLEEDVLVVDTESRHLSPKEAYEVVEGLTKRAKSAGVRYIYKKTDSALRGNVGAELAALLSASGCRQLPFFPAYPQVGRKTLKGIHYVDGVPVAESAFGKDPFAPVRYSYIPQLIKEQSDVPVKSFPVLTPQDEAPEDEGILVFDAQTDEDLAETGKKVLEQRNIHILAGCAGFGAVLPELLDIASKTPRAMPKLDPKLLVVCGSVNPITLRQLDMAEKNGFTRLRLSLKQKLEPDHWDSDEGKADLTAIEKMLSENPRCIIDTNDLEGTQQTLDYAKTLGVDREKLRVQISSGIGQLVGRIFPSPDLGTLLLTGGDTLLQCMISIGVSELEPICEMEKGVVLASFAYNGYTRHVITKSGGFGQENLLADLAEGLAGRENQKL